MADYTLIDGKAISEQVKQEIAAEVTEMVANGGKRPHLAAILVTSAAISCKKSVRLQRLPDTNCTDQKNG